MSPLPSAGVTIAVIVLAAGAFFWWNGREATPDVAGLSKLRQAGSNLRSPHSMEFFLYFPSKEAAQRASLELTREGFVVEVKPSASSSGSWLTLAKKNMVPAVAELVQIRESLSKLAATEHGQYDGCGASVVK